MIYHIFLDLALLVLQGKQEYMDQGYLSTATAGNQYSLIQKHGLLKLL